MDRQIVYPGSVPLETDLLNAQRNALVGLGKLAAAILGIGTVANGFACTPTAPASLQVQVAPGEIYSLQNLDGTAYSSLAADTTHQIVKQGILMDAVTLSCPAPGTAGQSINYLVQATYQDADTTPVALPYYNASNPSTAWSGPNNSGTAQNTKRQGQAIVTVKAGTSATTGSQVTPAPDAGNVGLWVVTVANGQATITSGNIAQYTGAPVIPYTLTQLAPLTSPNFGGLPTVPTQAQYDNSTKAASTAYVDRASRDSLQALSASVASNALTVTLNPTYLDFRSATLTSGAVNTRQVAAAISITVPSGATLGSASGVSSRLAILALDNSGTVELAVVNLSGGMNLDETTLISTSAVTGAANSATTAYSNVARSNLPFRVVGFVDISEATAGTWATGPTTVQGIGGEALATLSGIGYGQTWQSVTRASGTTYYNTTGKPITLQVWTTSTLGSQSGCSIVINGTTIQLVSVQAVSGQAAYGTASIMIPPGASYSVTDSNLASRSNWELR